LVAASGAVVAKNALIDVAWQGVAVGDSSLEKLILQVRQTLDPGDPHRYIKIVHRMGYQLVWPVTCSPRSPSIRASRWRAGSSPP
jgi:DNA-binding winged helix-turn-helix (wHTH) protein